jgi:hypothetical protein
MKEIIKTILIFITLYILAIAFYATVEIFILIQNQ